MSQGPIITTITLTPATYATSPRSAAPDVPSSGVTIPARPLEPPHGGFFGERGERWSRREHRRRQWGDNTNASPQYPTPQPQAMSWMYELQDDRL